MRSLTTILAFCDTNIFFVAGSLLLLASNAIAYRTKNTRLPFAASGICVLLAVGTGVFELASIGRSDLTDVKNMMTATLSGMLLVTLGASLSNGTRPAIMRAHTLITAALCVCLSIGLVADGKVDNEH